MGFWGSSEKGRVDERTAVEEYVLHGLGMETAIAGRDSWIVLATSQSLVVATSSNAF